MDSNEVKEMFILGQAVFLEGIRKLEECKQGNFLNFRNELIIKKRLAVVELTLGLELILKAVLKRRGFCINKKRKGIIDPEHTIELGEVIRLFSNENPALPFATADNLRKLRNQVIHKGTQIGVKKKEYFVAAIDCLVGVYKKDRIKHIKFLRLIEQAKNNI